LKDKIKGSGLFGSFDFEKKEKAVQENPFTKKAEGSSSGSSNIRALFSGS